MVLKKAFQVYIKNPKLIIFYLIFYLVLSLFAFFKIPIQSNSVFTDYVFAIIPAIILLLIYSVFLSIFIGAGYLAIKNQFSFKQSAKYSKFFFGNFIFILLFVLINFISIFFAKLFINFFNEFILAGISYFVFLFLSIFFIFSFFFYSINQESFLRSIKDSFNFSRKNYFEILIIPVLFLIKSFLISFIPEVFAQIIYFLVLYPLLTLVLTSFFISKSKTK